MGRDGSSIARWDGFRPILVIMTFEIFGPKWPGISKKDGPTMDSSSSSPAPDRHEPTDSKDFGIPRWRPGEPLPVRADKTDMARIVSHLVEPVSPSGLKFHPLLVTRPGRANLFDVESTLKYFRNRILRAGEYRLGIVRSRPRPPEMNGEMGNREGPMPRHRVEDSSTIQNGAKK
jgi:hypothetical protein